MYPTMFTCIRIAMGYICVMNVVHEEDKTSVQTSTVKWLALVCVFSSWLALVSGTRFFCQGFSCILLFTKSACQLLFQQGLNTFDVRNPMFFRQSFSEFAGWLLALVVVSVNAG